ncbi:hypothetical protein NDU88_005938 [Pleurodeles waltl]|uniref:Uncharacterized protein n=1 Tax=Pleurodeles waltl TaxID=8319 RepID=A0AAV7RNJ7_PLEWA|nr:hypothetical protein NDU88_005938 [Pleurodeles waltl]
MVKPKGTKTMAVALPTPKGADEGLKTLARTIVELKLQEHFRKFAEVLQFVFDINSSLEPKIDTLVIGMEYLHEHYEKLRESTHTNAHALATMRLTLNDAQGQIKAVQDETVFATVAVVHFTFDCAAHERRQPEMSGNPSEALQACFILDEEFSELMTRCTDLRKTSRSYERIPLKRRTLPKSIKRVHSRHHVLYKAPRSRPFSGIYV